MDVHRFAESTLLGVESIEASVALLGLPPKDVFVCHSGLVVGPEVASCSAVPPKLEAMPESLRTAQLVMM